MPATIEQANAYTAIEEWEEYEGSHIAYNELGDSVVEIGALMDRDQCLKWGDTYVPGREWSVYLEDGSIIRGHSPDLRAARKAAIAALNRHSTPNNEEVDQ